MSSEIQERLLKSVGLCLRPLVRMLLRSGISYRQFDGIAKRAFVAESLASSEQPRKRTNVSRIAVRTGLSRKEVARIRDLLEGLESGDSEQQQDAFHSNQAARVLQIWHSASSYVDSTGRPRELRFDSDDSSFASIVKMVGGDVPAGAVRAELLAAGAIEETSGGRLRALKRYFIPGDLGEDMVVGFQQIVAPLLAGLAHNSNSPKDQAYLQRIAYSDSLAAEDVIRFRQLASKRGEEFIQSVDDWLGENERGGREPAASCPRVGIGMFYFEDEGSKGSSR